MKKKIRERIKAIAAEIEKQEPSFSVSEMKAEVLKLYEALTLLEYLENQIDASGTLDQRQAMDSKSFREENWFTEPEPLPQSQHTEDLIEPLVEKIKDIVAQMPEEADRIDELLKEVLPEPKYIKNDLEEFAKNYQQMPTFERKKPEEQQKPSTVTELSIEKPKSAQPPLEIKDENKPETLVEQRAKSINDSIKKGLNIGLNDRLAFVNHLFDGSAEDYARVISQINTMESYDEALTFIRGKVKPDYNYWLQKDMYAERFLQHIEKSFN